MDLPSVVFVCTGNICRSVTAERVLEKHLDSIGAEAVVDSVGISDEEAGNPIDPRQARVLAAAGFRTEDHGARQITADWLAERDLAIAMTELHYRALQRLIADLPADSRPELRMLREFDPQAGDPQTGDPQASDPQAAHPQAAGTPTTHAPPAPDVPDPWYGGELQDFEETLETMERSVPGIADHLLDSETDAERY